MCLCYRLQDANVNSHHWCPWKLNSTSNKNYRTNLHMRWSQTAGNLKQAQHHLNLTTHAQIVADYSATIINQFTHFKDEYLQQDYVLSDALMCHWNTGSDQTPFWGIQQVNEIVGATVTSPRSFWSVKSEVECERLWLSLYWQHLASGYRTTPDEHKLTVFTISQKRNLLCIICDFNHWIICVCVTYLSFNMDIYLPKKAKLHEH